MRAAKASTAFARHMIRDCSLLFNPPRNPNVSAWKSVPKSSKHCALLLIPLRVDKGEKRRSWWLRIRLESAFGRVRSAAEGRY